MLLLFEAMWAVSERTALGSTITKIDVTIFEFVEADQRFGSLITSANAKFIKKGKTSITTYQLRFA